MEKARLEFTRRAGGTTYRNCSWWAFGEGEQVVGGPCGTKRELQQDLAAINRRVRQGDYGPRTLYTGY